MLEQGDSDKVAPGLVHHHASRFEAIDPSDYENVALRFAISLLQYQNAICAPGVGESSPVSLNDL